MSNIYRHIVYSLEVGEQSPTLDPRSVQEYSRQYEGSIPDFIDLIRYLRTHGNLTPANQMYLIEEVFSTDDIAGLLANDQLNSLLDPFVVEELEMILQEAMLLEMQGAIRRSVSIVAA